MSPQAFYAGGMVAQLPGGRHSHWHCALAGGSWPVLLVGDGLSPTAAAHMRCHAPASSGPPLLPVRLLMT